MPAKKCQVQKTNFAKIRHHMKIAKAVTKFLGRLTVKNGNKKML